MKTSAIVRIILYSLVLILLVGVLLAGLGIGPFMFQIGSGSSEYNTGEGSVNAADITALNIDWAAGSITIQTGDTDQITFTESGNFSDDYAMVYEVKKGKLTLQYGKPSMTIGFVSTPSKDLVITVPENWSCEEIELDGAALEVAIQGLDVQELNIDGAAFEVFFDGELDSLSCDGAACELQITCSNRPQKLDLDGAACSFELTIPEGCGFEVLVDGLACDFDADVNYSIHNDAYVYGDEHCQIDVDGVSCDIQIDTLEPEYNSSAVLQEARNIYNSYLAAFDYTSGSTPAAHIIIEVDTDNLYMIAVDGTILPQIYRTISDANESMKALGNSTVDPVVIKAP